MKLRFGQPARFQDRAVIRESLRLERLCSKQGSIRLEETDVRNVKEKTSHVSHRMSRLFFQIRLVSYNVEEQIEIYSRRK